MVGHLASRRPGDIWHAACDIIFEELCEGRGVTVPSLGTFTVSFHGTQGTRVSKRPHFVLAANFERLGVRLAAARPSAGAIRLIGWKQVALRCSVDRDLVQRSVNSLLSAFASKVAAMDAAGARSSANLDLGRCGMLRVVRCGEQAMSLEPRVTFSTQLADAVSRGDGSAAPPVSSVSARAVVASTIVPGAAVDSSAASPAEEPAPAVRDALFGRPYISLSKLSQLMNLEPGGWGSSAGWGGVEQPAAQPSVAAPALEYVAEAPGGGAADGGRADDDEARAEASARYALAVAAETLAAEAEAAAAAAGATGLATATAAAGLGSRGEAGRSRRWTSTGYDAPPPPHGLPAREPSHALPQTASGVDEWAASKRMQTWMDAARVHRLPEPERRRRALVDEDNLRAARQRSRSAAPSRTHAAKLRTEAGVLTLLRRLSPPSRTATDVELAEKAAAAEPADELTADERALLEQKRALEARLAQLELQLLETASVRSNATAASVRSSRATRRSMSTTATRSRAKGGSQEV